IVQVEFKLDARSDAAHAQAATGATQGGSASWIVLNRSEEHTSELQSLTNLVCRLLLEKKKKDIIERNTECWTKPSAGKQEACCVGSGECRLARAVAYLRTTYGGDWGTHDYATCDAHHS